MRNQLGEVRLPLLRGNKARMKDRFGLEEGELTSTAPSVTAYSRRTQVSTISDHSVDEVLVFIHHYIITSLLNKITRESITGRPLHKPGQLRCSISPL